jgi:DNA-binding transcriptional MerR regulator
VDPVAEDDLLTIEQLAARTQLSVRNIRSHVTRGLLPAPRLRRRTGYYDAGHVARLELITSLQQQGFNLTAIAKLVKGPVATSAEETVAFYRTILSAWLPEPAEVRSETDLAAMYGEQPDPQRRDTLERLGIIEVLDDGMVRLRNPALLRAGVQVAALGYDVDTLLGLAQVLADHTRAVAEACLAMFTATHWQPYVAAGQPPAELPELRRVIEELQPLASQAIVAAFQQEMTALVTQTFTGSAFTGSPATESASTDPATT